MIMVYESVARTLIASEQKHQSLFGHLYEETGLLHIAEARDGAPLDGERPVGMAVADVDSVSAEDFPSYAPAVISVCNGSLVGFYRRGNAVEEVPVTIVRSKDLMQRCEGLIDARIKGKAVTCIGLGMGARVAELLVQSGLTRFVLVDFDTVSPFIRTGFPYWYAGVPKTSALKQRLLSLNPDLEIEVFPIDIMKAGQAAKRKIFGTDVVVACVDDIRAQMGINRSSLHFGVPAVFGSYYPQGDGGEAIYVAPPKWAASQDWWSGEATCCYACAFASRLNGSGRTPAPQPALAVDIEFVANRVAQFSLALLGDPLRQHLVEDPTRNICFLSTGLDPRTRTQLFDSSFSEVAASAEESGCPECADGRT